MALFEPSTPHFDMVAQLDQHIYIHACPHHQDVTSIQSYSLSAAAS